MKVWIDDMRNPADYGQEDAIWFKTSQEAMAFLNDPAKLYRRVTEWSFDNDLGEDSDQDGYDAFLRLEELLMFGKPCFGSPTIFVHTSNPSAGDKFMLAKESMLRYGIQMKRVHY